MKVYSLKPQEDLNALANLIAGCMQTESDYETLKCKTDDTDLFQWVETKQESTTDFIMSALRLFDELNFSNHANIGMPSNINTEILNTKSLIVNLNSEVFIRECKKIGEAHWHFIMKEMSKYNANSKVYQLLNKRLEILNNKAYSEERTPLLVG